MSDQIEYTMDDLYSCTDLPPEKRWIHRTKVISDATTRLGLLPDVTED